MFKAIKFQGLFLAILICGIITLVYLLVSTRPVAVDFVRVSRGLYQETILADGILRSKDKYTVPAPANGDIKRMPLKVGDIVKKGQTITELYWDVKFDPVAAPIDGVISKVYREAAGPIQRGEPIIEIVDPSQLEIVSELLTNDAVRLEVGSLVKVLEWSGAENVEARISRISRAGFVKSSALGVEEERTEVTANVIQIPQTIAAKVGNTFHVDVSFLVSETPNAIKIPTGALFKEGSNWYVYAVEGKRAKKRKITLGAKNSREAWVVNGLLEDEIVINYPGDLIKENSRVAPIQDLP